MATFELELSIREKRTFMAILASLRREYKGSLRAAERGEVSFESEEQKERLVKETTRASDVLTLVLDQLHDQNPN